jgi:hypothetical protein
MTVLSPELRAWLVPGLAGVMATADSSRQPQIVRVWAARALPGRDVLEVYTQRSVSDAWLEALTRSGRAALNLIDVPTYRSRMFKGPCEPSSEGPEAGFLNASLAAFNRAVSAVGMAADTAQRIMNDGGAPGSMVALVLTVESVFDQSPKPGAGARL